MPRLRLPPLPHPSTFRDVFLSTGTANCKIFKSTLEGSIVSREISKRPALASQTLADKFVRDLGLRDNEVVIDAYSGPGQLTRSLLAGGHNETTRADWKKVVAEQPDGVKPDFPAWDVSKAVDADPEPLPISEEEKVKPPKLVIATDGHAPSLCRSLGLLADKPAKETKAILKRIYDKGSDSVPTEGILFPSHLQKNLLLCSASMYSWPILPRILSSPLVYPSLEVYDKTKEGPEAYQRPWEAPPPHITVTIQAPQGIVGDQLLNQWVSSVIGSKGHARSWLWKWGRVRLALLASKGTYDRLMAQPGETVHNKIAVMANALFHLRPIVPCHHVPNADKRSTKTETAQDIALGLGKQGRSGRPAEAPTMTVTPTTSHDFFAYGRTAKNSKPLNLPRPELLGIEMIPRLDPIVVAEQRDMWDFLLRKFFVREASALGDVVPTVAFGAENLLPRFADMGNTFTGEPVSLDKAIRDINVNEWARIVDVFDKWAFKPTHLIPDVEIIEDNRQVGLSL